ncbi:hypothetical protein OG607_40025 [Streptomyces sp. NBC_01537]|uniref:hypothetical protein n=1 Tax=Streptomyces sp. NBC_01537 TaxID=2903896 RepID=UPI003869E545
MRRWVLEVVELLAARAERLERALKKVTRKGGHVVLVDGTLIRTRRRTGKDNRRNYSGKHTGGSSPSSACTSGTPPRSCGPCSS